MKLGIDDYPTDSPVGAIRDALREHGCAREEALLLGLLTALEAANDHALHLETDDRALHAARSHVVRQQHAGAHIQDRLDARAWMDEFGEGRCRCDACERDDRKMAVEQSPTAPKDRARRPRHGSG